MGSIPPPSLVNSAVLLSRLRVGATPCSTVILPMTLSPFMMEIAALRSSSAFSSISTVSRSPDRTAVHHDRSDSGTASKFFSMVRTNWPAWCVAVIAAEVPSCEILTSESGELNLTAGFGVSSSEHAPLNSSRHSSA